MDDRDGLLRAVVAAPDDDLPRLVFADWLEEHDEADRAAFVRAQCELAGTPPWEPFAAFCRHRRPDWATGEPFRGTLPATDPRFIEWHPAAAFRRGFGWSLVVREMRTFLDQADRLFDLAPVGQLHLPNGTLDDWKRFAARPWLPRVTSVHFYSTTTPIEPVRVLCDAPLASGLEEIVFEKAGSHAMPELVAGLARSPLGRQLRQLEFRLASESLEELIDALGASPGLPRLERLGLITSTLTPDLARRLAAAALLAAVTDLDLTHCTALGENGVRKLFPSVGLLRPQRLNLSDTRARVGAIRRLARADQLAGLRGLDLSSNTMDADDLRPLTRGRAQAGLRFLRLRHCRLPDEAVADLTGAAFWTNLVELDLRDNRLTDAGVGHLLAAPVPPDLTALLLSGNPITPSAVERLRGHYWAAVIWAAGHP